MWNLWVKIKMALSRSVKRSTVSRDWRGHTKRLLGSFECGRTRNREVKYMRKWQNDWESVVVKELPFSVAPRLVLKKMADFPGSHFSAAWWMAFRLSVNRQVGLLRITLLRKKLVTPNQNRYRLNRVIEETAMKVGKIRTSGKTAVSRYPKMLTEWVFHLCII